VSLFSGITILTLAILLGGIAAVWRERGRRVMPGIRTFATVAAAAIALLHLIPEAITDAGWGTLVAAAAGLFGPALLERIGARSHKSAPMIPTSALLIGYGAVLVHQVGEGAAVASLAHAGALSAPIVLAIAAHTVPLAMVIAIQAIHHQGSAAVRAWLAAVLALLGVVLATLAGSLSVDLMDAGLVGSLKPWLLAGVAGLLLHAALHEHRGREPRSLRGRIGDVGAGLIGLSLALVGIDKEGWVGAVPWPLRLVALVALSAAIVLRYAVSPRAHDGPAGAAR
jgi:hypothetical protein